MERKEKLVELLIEKGIIRFKSEESSEEENPKITSPAYVKFDEIEDDSEICNLIVSILEEKIDEKLSPNGNNFNFIVGIGNIGIIIGKIIADKYQKPFTRIISGQTYGGSLGLNNVKLEIHNPIEGKALIVEDLIYTNGNMVKEADLIRRMGATVVMGASILTYNNVEYQGETALKQIPLIYALTIDEVLIICIQKNIIKTNDFEILKNFFVDPKSWYERNFPKTASN